MSVCMDVCVCACTLMEKCGPGDIVAGTTAEPIFSTLVDVYLSVCRQTLSRHNHETLPEYEIKAKAESRNDSALIQEWLGLTA